MEKKEKKKLLALLKYEAELVENDLMISDKRLNDKADQSPQITSSTSAALLSKNHSSLTTNHLCPRRLHF